MDYKELCCKIIDSHDGLVYVTDMETNEVIFVNKKLLQVIGKNKAEVFGKPFLTPKPVLPLLTVIKH